jgi:transposase
MNAIHNSQSGNLRDKTLDHDSTQYAALIGIDWGDKEHAFHLKSNDGTFESGTLRHSSETLFQWLSKLEERFDSRPVAFAIEAQSPPLLAAIRQFSWAVVFQIHPITSKRLRTAFTPSGAKDDLPDAKVLLDLLISHRDKLRPLPEPVSPKTRILDGICRERRELVDQRTKWCLQTRAALKAYFPQAFELFSDELFRPIVSKFLARWPDLISLKTEKTSTIKRFYTSNGYRNVALIDQRLEIIKTSIAIEIDPSRISEYTRKVKHILERIELANRQIKELDLQMSTVFKEHENWQFFRELPGAGPSLAPRLLCAINMAPENNAQGMQKYFGTAPVKEKSGSRVWTHRRWNAPRFFHQTWVEWAGLSVQHSRWAKEFYEQAKARGKGRYTALRALAFKWMRVIARCIETKTDYNEELYIQSLKKRRSPLAQRL